MNPPQTSNRFLFTIGYDGTAFQGWQVQPGRRTVQGEIENVFAAFSGGAHVRPHASGRTDTGVHARGQCAHVDVPIARLDADRWVHALNGALPPDIRIYSARRVPPDFHARFDASRKEYRYFIHRNRILPPELRHYRLREPRRLDLAPMHAACRLLTGTHDFTSFSATRGYDETNTVRTLFELEILEAEDLLTVRAVADGFLYRMVRQLTGALLRVGRGELTLETISDLLAHPRRTAETPSAPPQGLFLWEVHYPEAKLCL